jgi:two-component system alkaline phosphatase synthesis response regulator PhoP
MADPKRILIVEDEAHIRLLIEQTLEDLEDAGVELLSAADGAQGLDLIRAKHPDLVLLDVMMPVMDGFEVCRRLRDDPANAATRVIFLTAKGQEYDRTHGITVGADGYVTKPFNPDDLLATVSAAIGVNVT